MYESLAPDENGVWRSEVFSGLWLQPETFWSGDLAEMLAVLHLQEGLAAPEHTTFVEQLSQQK